MHIINPYRYAAGGPPSTLLDGLTAWWTLDESSGTRFDSHTNNLDISDNNTVTQATGKVNNAAEFTSANSEYLSRASETLLSPINASFAYSFWIYNNTASVLGCPLSKYTSTNPEFRVLILSSKVRFDITTTNTSNGAILSDATWHHVVVYRNAGTGKLGIIVDDNTPAEISSSGTGTPAAPFNVGRQGDGSFYFDGRVDEIGYWKGRVLTSAEITELAGGVGYPG